MIEDRSPIGVSEQGVILQAFSKVLGKEAHVLTQQPDILWQQLYNRLQWEDGDRSGPISKVIDPEFKKRISHRPFAGSSFKIRIRQSEAVIRNLL